MAKTTSNKTTFILLSILFFLFGFITVFVDSLIPRLRELFTLTYFEAGMVQFAFFGAYFVLSIPASYILTKIGYKGGIILGLLTMAVGCAMFYPAAAYRIFGIFIFGYFTLAGGMTILQVAINPYVAVLGSEETASSRLNLSQAFNSLGTALAPTVGALFILSDTIKTNDEIKALEESAREVYYASEAEAVQNPFIGIVIFILAITSVFFFIKLPKLINKVDNTTYIQAFKQKNLMLGVLGIFCYVGAEVSIGSYLVNYFLDMNLVDTIKSTGLMKYIAELFLSDGLAAYDGKAIVGVFVTFYWSGAMIGRFLGSYLTRQFNPGKIIAIFASSALTLLLISMNSNGLLAMWSILGVGLFNSIMFPTIFTLALGGINDLKPKGSGLLCTAIVGGAFVPPIFGHFIDLFGFKLALIVIMSCYAYILYFGWRNGKRFVR